MALYTSYFSCQDLPAQAVTVSISCTYPRSFCPTEVVKCLAPDTGVLYGYKGGRISEEEFAGRYRQMLDRDPEAVKRVLVGLEEKYAGKDVVLLSWDAPGKPCHRHYLAEWLMDRYGMEVREWTGRVERKEVRVEERAERSAPRISRPEKPVGIRVAVIGSWRYNDRRCFFDVLNAEHNLYGGLPMSIVSCGGSSIDIFAEEYAAMYGMRHVSYALDTDRNGMNAGFLLNREIIGGCDACVVFMDEESWLVRNVVGKCRDANRPCLVVRYKKDRFERIGSLEPKGCIKNFSGLDSFLSNTAPAKVVLYGVEYPSVENAYYAAMALRKEDRERMAEVAPGHVRREARKFEKCEDWESRRDDVMRDLLNQKFAPDTEMARRLLMTGSDRIVNVTFNGDIYWGIDSNLCRGRNHLGEMLMLIRDGLRKRKSMGGNVVEEKESFLFGMK